MEFNISYDKKKKKKNGAIIRGKMKNLNFYSFDIGKVAFGGSSNSITLSNCNELQRIKRSFFLRVEYSTSKEHNYFGLLKAEIHEMILLCIPKHTLQVSNNG
jgi:hypothetical protein